MQNWEQAIISPTDESVFVTSLPWVTLQWRHNGHDSISNHQPHNCLLNRLFRRRSKKTSKLRVTALCAGNSPGTSEFPAQMASYAENVSISWRHHDWTWTGSMSAKGHLIESSKCELSSAFVMAVTCVVHNIMLCWTMAWRHLETPLYVLYHSMTRKRYTTHQTSLTRFQSPLPCPNFTSTKFLGTKLCITLAKFINQYLQIFNLLIKDMTPCMPFNLRKVWGFFLLLLFCFCCFFYLREGWWCVGVQQFSS